MSRDAEVSSTNDEDPWDGTEVASALQLEVIQTRFYPMSLNISAGLRKLRQEREELELVAIVHRSGDTSAGDSSHPRRARFGVWLPQPLAVALIILAIGTLATASWRAFIHPTEEDSVVSTSFEGVYLPGECSTVIPPLDRSHERFTRPRGGGPPIEILPPAVSVEGGRLLLRNRGYLVVDHDFQTGVEIELKWMWTQPVAEGIYCDQLAIVVRTDAKPRSTWPHEIAQGLVVKFDPSLRQVKLARAAGDDGSPHELLAIADGVDLEIGQWHALSVRDSGDAILVTVNGATVIEVPVSDQASAHRVVVYNREPVGGSVLRHPDKVSYLDELLVRRARLEDR